MGKGIRSQTNLGCLLGIWPLLRSSCLTEQVDLTPVSLNFLMSKMALIIPILRDYEDLIEIIHI